MLIASTRSAAERGTVFADPAGRDRDPRQAACTTSCDHDPWRQATGWEQEVAADFRRRLPRTGTKTLSGACEVEAFVLPWKRGQFPVPFDNQRSILFG